jgi:hypothetical protein
MPELIAPVPNDVLPL